MARPEMAPELPEQGREQEKERPEREQAQQKGEEAKRKLKTADLAGVGDRDRAELSRGGRQPELIRERGSEQSANPQARGPVAVPPGRETSQERPAALVDRATADRFQTRWNDIQVSFVDEPRRAVEQMSRQYDKAGIDPGRGFEEVARRAAAGERPEALKEIVADARKKLTE